MEGRSYSFRPVVQRDLPILDAWQRTSEVVRWWGDPGREAALLRADLAAPGAMTMEIVSFDGAPFAYAQNYEVHAWPQAHFDTLPPGSRAIDAFIGEPAMIGCGHGAAFLRILATRLRSAGAPLVAIDPAVDNLRARRAYEKAGFVVRKIAATPDGPVALMIFGDESAAQ